MGCLMGAACSAPDRLAAVPLALAGNVGFADIANVRFGADDGDALARELLAAA